MTLAFDGTDLTLEGFVWLVGLAVVTVVILGVYFYYFNKIEQRKSG